MQTILSFQSDNWWRFVKFSFLLVLGFNSVGHFYDFIQQSDNSLNFVFRCCSNVNRLTTRTSGTATSTRAKTSKPCHLHPVIISHKKTRKSLKIVSLKPIIYTSKEQNDLFQEIMNKVEHGFKRLGTSMFFLKLWYK